MDICKGFIYFCIKGVSCLITENESIRIENFKNWYEKNESKYNEAANFVHDKILNYIKKQKFNVANSYARAKTVDSVYKKAKKMVKRDGEYTLKYSDPQNQIKDFSGVRIIVYLASDIKVVTDAVERLFKDHILYDDSGNKIDLLGEDKVGYLSIHYVVTIDTNELEYAHLKGIKCEIQIRTVLQDAWAQVFHDRLYKGSIGSTDDSSIVRKTNLLSGSLELIDGQIDEIVKYYDSKNGNLSKKAYQELLNEVISENTLSEYCESLLNGKVEKYYSYRKVKELLSSIGIETIRELDYCVNEEFINEIKNLSITITIDRLVRYILFLSNYEDFFSNTDCSQRFVIDMEIYDLLDKFVDMKEICKKYTNLIINDRKENIND